MTLGVADRQASLLDDMSEFCEKTLAKDSIYAFLHRERDRLFPDEAFADLFADDGRRSVPPSVVAAVMVLQRLEGLSDREAAERYAFDARWRYAAGVGSYDTSEWTIFSHTVFVDMRERLRRSTDPDRVFAIVLGAAKAAGLVGRKRVLDSTPLYDAVATMDTITLIRSAVRNLLKVTDGSLRAEVLAVLTSGDDYASSDKPQIDWEDAPARERLVDTRAKDAYGCLLALEGRELTDVVTEAARLLATVVGQDLEEGDDKILRIARKVAKDRVISVVDPEARHGHKTSAHGFDGYKGHVAIDPDSEIITATTVSAGNAGDASVAEQLIGDLLENDEVTGDDAVREGQGEPGALGHERATVYGDAAYGTGEPPVPLERRQHRLEMQDPATCGKEWVVHKGPLPCRPRHRHGHVSERRDREDPATERRRWDREVRYALCHLPARLAVHHVTNRAKDPRRDPRSRRCPCTRRAEGPEMESRLQSDASKSRAQARPPHETKTRGKARESARKTTGCSRLQSSRCRSQPCTPRQARGSFDRRRRMDDGPMTRRWRPMASHACPSRPVDRYESALFATSSTPSRGAKNAFSTTSSCPPVTLNPCSTPGT